MERDALYVIDEITGNVSLLVQELGLSLPISLLWLADEGLGPDAYAGRTEASFHCGVAWLMTKDIVNATTR